MKKMMTLLLSLVMLSTVIVGCKEETKETTLTSDQAITTPDTEMAATEETEAILPTSELTISAAASLKNVMTELTTAFAEEQPNVTLTFNFGASGELQTQIESGAPADIFISAAQKQMTALSDESLMVSDSIVNLLENEVVLIVPSDSSLGLTSFDDLTSDDVTMIAIGDPASVPAGTYATAVFDSLGITDAISGKFVLGSDVTQVLTYVEGGEVDAGVVYSTDALSSEGVTVVAQAPEGSHDAIIYPAGIVAASTNQEAADAFLAFLQTPEAMAIFESYGFQAA